MVRKQDKFLRGIGLVKTRRRSSVSRRSSVVGKNQLPSSQLSVLSSRAGSSQIARRWSRHPHSSHVPGDSADGETSLATYRQLTGKRNSQRPRTNDYFSIP